MITKILKSKSLLRRFTSKIDFEARDMEEYVEYNQQFYEDKRYLKQVNLWKKPLEKKLARRARRNERLKELEPPQPQDSKLVIHNPALPLKLPVKPYNIFAILSLNGTQYKVKQKSPISFLLKLFFFIS